jgi:hypothetical protein
MPNSSPGGKAHTPSHRWLNPGVVSTFLTAAVAALLARETAAFMEPQLKDVPDYWRGHGVRIIIRKRGKDLRALTSRRDVNGSMTPALHEP